MAVRELYDEPELPKNEVSSSSVVELAQSGDGAPSERAVLGVAMRAAADAPEVAGCGGERRLRRSLPERGPIAFFGENLLDPRFLIVVYPRIPECEGTWRQR